MRPDWKQTSNCLCAGFCLRDNCGAFACVTIVVIGCESLAVCHSALGMQGEASLMKASCQLSYPFPQHFPLFGSSYEKV